MAFDAGNYCKRCTSILDYTHAQKKQCDYCGWSVAIGEKEALSSAVTVTRVAQVKRWQKENAFAVPNAPGLTEINEECPKCGNPKMMFWTRQTRSADEGQTCYYQCKNCNYRRAENS